MSNYNYDYDDTAQAKPKGRLDIWDMLSILALLLTACVGVYFLLIFLFPNSGFNPYPPGALNASPTPTITPIHLDATWTPTLPPFVTETATLFPTLTLEPSATLLSLVTPSITPTATKAPKRPFDATVKYIDSTIIHADSACNWQGIGGTVVDTDNQEIVGSNFVIMLSGTYNGKTLRSPGTDFLVTVPGIQRGYGLSGWEFFLGTVPILSTDEMFVQIIDSQGLPLSEKVLVSTYNDCAKNLALVRFKKNP